MPLTEVVSLKRLIGGFVSALGEWLIEQFVRHVIERYGLTEVQRWYFEVWNAPSLCFFWKDVDDTAFMAAFIVDNNWRTRLDGFALILGGQ